MNRFFAALLGALLILQPVVGYAFTIPQRNMTEMKQKAQDVRAKDIQKVKQAKGLQQARLAIQELPECVEVIDECCGCYAITPDCFGEESDTTFVITEPGKYTLQQDVVFFPADEFTPAINILSDNVTLDLCSHTLSQGNDTPNVYGVQIGEGYFYADPDNVLNNIEIRNGNIVDFSAIGVFCYNGSFDEPTAELSFEDLRFYELNIFNCGSTTDSFDFASGIDLDSFADLDPTIIDFPVAYKNVLIKNCTVNECFGTSAIQIYTVENIVVEDTQANNQKNEVNNLGGTSAHEYFGRNIKLMNCQGNGVQDLDPERKGAQCIPCNIETSRNIFLKNCQFNDAYGEADSIINSNFSYDYNFIAEDCQFNNNRGGASALDIIAGVHMSDGPGIPLEADSMKFINCQFNGTRISDEAAGGHKESLITGFVAVTLKNIIFENCQACNIQTENPGYAAYGFIAVTYPSDPPYPFANSNNLSFINCVISDIKGARNTYGIVTPFANVNSSPFQSEHKNQVFENCIIERITGLSSTDRVAGIGISRYPVENGTEYPLAKNVYIRDCRISDVRAGEGNPFSSAILLESVQNPVIENNSVSDCDRGILFTGTNDIIPNAFQLALTRADALASPPVPIDIAAPVGPSSLETFKNKTHKSKVSVLVPDDVDAQHDFLFPINVVLNDLHWESGDKIVYHANGGPVITGLMDGATYYAIVYSPGYTVRGLVQNNNVTNCLISGYQDDRSPTDSAWINNMALLNGSPKPSHKANFAIKWIKKPQVDEGTLAEYPKCPNKNFNTSLIYAKKKR